MNFWLPGGVDNAFMYKNGHDCQWMVAILHLKLHPSSCFHLYFRADKYRKASKKRRDLEHDAILALARELPLTQDVISQLDKASILRLTAAYFRLKLNVGNGEYIQCSRLRLTIDSISFGMTFTLFYNQFMSLPQNLQAILICFAILTKLSVGTREF